MKKGLFCLAAFACAVIAAESAIQFQTIEYKQGDTTCEGVLVYDDSAQGRRPGVLIAHQWKGLTEYERKRAEMLARLGYVAFCADVYGKGVRPNNPKDASAMAGKYKADRALLRARINAGLDTFRSQAQVASGQVAAIGYCFGGTTVLELARSGADIAGVVSFHGGLSAPSPAEASKVKAKVLALHGADDPFVPNEEVIAFEKEMRDAKVDWQLVAYGGAVHSFTDWNAGTDNSKGSAYNKAADERSWRAMKDFFTEALR